MNNFKQNLKKAINKINGNDYYEVAEVTVDARTLYDLGWEFIEDYQDFRDDKFSHNYTKEELKDYETFVDASEIRLFLRLESQMDYLIGRKETDWSQADAFVPAGDEDLLADDLNYMIENDII